MSGPPEREWKFQQYQVSRFRCERGDTFNFYAGPHKTFTIPRSGKGPPRCKSCGTINPQEAIYCKDCGTKI